MTEANTTPEPDGSQLQEREAAGSERAKAVTNREGAVTAREGTATRREEAAGIREETAGLREETSSLREEAVRAREDAAQARIELEALMVQVRKANEHLVIASVHAQSMTETAERANRLKDEFLATVSHELRTPLNAILGWARMLASNQLSSDRSAHAVVVVERNAVALARIIEDLLDVSRIVAGTLHLAPRPIDLVAVARGATDAIRPLAAAKNVRLTFSSRPAAVEPVSGDPNRLQQVIWNVVANAIKFTPRGGRVDVSVESSTDHIEIRIVDTGQGISPDFLPHVFDRFRQGDSATTRRESGLGLGLAIVRQLVELHGGTVDAASSGEGRGATFLIRLPIAVGYARLDVEGALKERRTALATQSPALPVTRLDDLRVLVVDDSEDGRALTSLVLTQAGASVIAVPSVRDALDVLEREPLHALVSDIGMPDQDGYALIRQIRQHEVERGGHLPAVALTGYARASDRVRILEAGFQTLVTKPLDFVELTAAIAAITQHLRDEST
jgi:signal transduction histidine kinase/ActR/RegA family two-component response regulator